MSKKVSNFNGKNMEDTRGIYNFHMFNDTVVLNINRNNQVHEVYPRMFENPKLPDSIPLYDFLHGRTRESAIGFLNAIKSLS